jgi:hypothetical protein
MSMRTHYCGLTTEALLGQTVSLCGWVHRRRDHGGVIFIDLRDREGLVQVVCNPEQAEVFKVAEARAQRVLPARDRRGQGPPGRHRQRQPEVGQDRSGLRAAGSAEPVRGRAVPARRRQPVGNHPPDAPRAGPAPSADAEQPAPALQSDDGSAQVPGQPGLHRHRDADADEVDPGRRARLSGAVARQRGPVLRAAAVAAAVQAAADGRQLRPLLPDHQVLPRRRPARRPPA